MDKLYSKRVLIYKAALCVILAPLYALLSVVVSSDNTILYLIVSCVPIGCVYTIPFWASLVHIKKYRVGKVGKYVLYDAVSCFLPAVFGFLALEIVTAIANGSTSADGFVTMIFFVIFSLLSALFWLMYLIYSKIK